MSAGHHEVLARKRMVVQIAIQIAAHMVALRSHSIAGKRRIACDGVCKIVFNGHIRPTRFHPAGHKVHKIRHRFILELCKLGIFRCMRSRLLRHVMTIAVAVQRTAVFTIAGMRPKGHVKKESVKVEIRQHLVDLRAYKRAVLRMSWAAETIAASSALFLRALLPQCKQPFPA